MEAFLSRVARVYLEQEYDQLPNYCFVFPNKRSGVFFGKYITTHAPSSFIMPEITTISDLVNDFSEGVEASKYEQLFILYNIYKSLNVDVTEFDQFQFWGDMILNDFSDVDRYMVDPKQLFVNVSRLKEISSNYLTQEQLEVLNKYFGENRSTDFVEHFWRHIDYGADEGKPRDRFLKLWEVLLELYTRFNDEMQNRGLTYSGRSYRQAAQWLSKVNQNDIPYDRYIFIGFNTLSTAEIKIFERLKELNSADFYWDYNSPAFLRKGNKASRFISKYIKKFPSRHDIGEEPITNLPSINVIGMPSNAGQVKMTGVLLNQMIETHKITQPDDAINTAVVLPDENLFIPLIHSFPKQLTSVNITMGFPMRFTPVATLMRAIVSMHLRARIVRDQLVYFYEDVQDVLSQPLIKAFASEDCDKLQRYILDKRIFNIPAKTLIEEYPKLEFLFTPVKDLKNANEVFGYTIRLTEFIQEQLGKLKQSSLDMAFIARYKQALMLLHSLMSKYHIEMTEHTFFHLIERSISTERVNFEGEPLKGLQIMGVLETRALDFDNIIMLSMNERIFPRKHYTRTFIPDALRRGYGMSTIEHQESMYAYYFYRLISRAKNVYLLYDGRTTGIRHGDMSRFLYQLRLLFPNENIKFRLAEYDILGHTRRLINMPKSQDIMNRLNMYRTHGSKKYLSASAIKLYVHCPLRFYLERIEGLSVEEEIKDYMDDITYGDIVHEVVERIYKRFGTRVITAQTLDELAERSDTLLRLEITKMINKHFNKLGNENETPVIGESEVLADIMLFMVKNMFRVEKEIAPIHFISAEEEMNIEYKVSDNLTVNFRQYPDRIDRATVNGHPTLRIVDYKTGGDEIKSTFEKIFDNSYAEHNGAILQLFIYCLLYSIHEKNDEPIQPIIYKMRALTTLGLSPIEVNKVKVYDYHQLKDEFIGYFNKTLEEIFNPEIPFAQTKNDKNCRFCNFKNLCGKDKEKQF